ncbi:PREDICTED: fetuin-B-like [Thamnophis sirtalis]|uniref:Fetuin-B-like n=1 Tax=Thamnophis sirtalis TaxID=35019 RepID=A0A6I9Z3Z4_9SAUR|nr:PREDICTED: fetuin-B-like [Thamnophis sirtalis]
MALLISFLIGIQLFYAVVSVPFPLSLSTSCNSLGVRIAAEVALNKVNENRKEGYVLGLQRIFDVLEAIQGDESAFDLILDVLETQCHVRSRKPWKECEFRSPHETVWSKAGSRSGGIEIMSAGSIISDARISSS